MLLVGQSTLATLTISQVVVMETILLAMETILFAMETISFTMETIMLAMEAQRCLALLTLPILVSALISKDTKIGDVNNALVTPPLNDLPGDDEGGDGLYPTSESEFEDESQDGDVGREPEPAPQVVDPNDINEVADAEDLEPDNHPLLNHAQQAEVEHSQEPGLQLEIEKFGGKAGRPIRSGQPTTADDHETQLGSDGANPYAPFHSRTDWEVAKWGKLRGPTSTAFTELLEIPGVSAWVIWSSTMI